MTLSRAPGLASAAAAASLAAPSEPEPELARRLARLSGHLVVALVALVAIGGATRVMEAGLACPDWPLCYGLLLPGRQMNLQVFLEWFHRLDAFVVGIGLLVLCGASLRWRARLPGWLPWASGAALALVALQGGLGALTVLQLLAAGVVTAHLAVALLLVALLSAIHQRLNLLASTFERPTAEPPASPLWLAPLAALAALLLLGQCLLGAAMASQWAADRCLQAGEACRWLLAHRLLAYPAAASVLLVSASVLALPAAGRATKGLAAAAAALVLSQVAIGVWSLRLALAAPLLTVAHQISAALLIALLVALASRSWRPFNSTMAEVAHG
ncbi:MAG: COX15/CtaA family protein [Prochlorococcaceae cyanobacterium]